MYCHLFISYFGKESMIGIWFHEFGWIFQHLRDYCTESVRQPGIEPRSQEWESCMIPLHYWRLLKLLLRSFDKGMSVTTNKPAIWQIMIHLTKDRLWYTFNKCTGSFVPYLGKESMIHNGKLFHESGRIFQHLRNRLLQIICAPAGNRTRVARMGILHDTYWRLLKLLLRSFDKGMSVTTNKPAIWKIMIHLTKDILWYTYVLDHLFISYLGKESMIHNYTGSIFLHSGLFEYCIFGMHLFIS